MKFNSAPGRVALLSAGFWIASLFFPTFVPYHEPKEHMFGFTVLLFGWISLLGISWAWAANPLLLLSLIVRNDFGQMLAVAASIISLHTFMIDTYPTGNVNDHAEIFGYGWGVLLWFVAIGFGLVHAGMLPSEGVSPEEAKTKFPWLFYYGVLWIITFSAVFAYQAITDRIKANSSDSALLKSALFKRNPVCTSEPPVPAALPSTPISLLEIANENIKPTEILGWGVPTVRLRSHDYSYIGSAHDRILQIAPAQGKPSGLMVFNSTYDQRSKKSTQSLHIQLDDSGNSSFRYVWNSDGPKQCPPYDLKKTVTAALGLTDKAEKRSFFVPVAADGTVIGQESAFTGEWSVNYNCPRNTGYSFNNTQALKIVANNPFFIDSIGYELPYPSGKALCSGDSTFFYATTRHSDNFVMTVSKRNAKNLESQWLSQIQVKNAPPALNEYHTRVVAIIEKGDAIIVKTQHYGHDQVLTIQAPHPKTLPPPKLRQ